MSKNFLVFPNIDGNKVFPPEVRQALADSPELNSTFVTFVDDTTGLPLVDKHVTIKINATTNDITDIIVEDI
jgi:hypothetical protein